MNRKQLLDAFARHCGFVDWRDYLRNTPNVGECVLLGLFVEWLVCNYNVTPNKKEENRGSED